MENNTTGNEPDYAKELEELEQQQREIKAQPAQAEDIIEQTMGQSMEREPLPECEADEVVADDENGEVATGDDNVTFNLLDSFEPKEVVGLMEFTLPVVVAVMLKGYNKIPFVTSKAIIDHELISQEFELTAKERRLLEKPLARCLESTTVKFKNPWLALLAALGTILTMKTAKYISEHSQSEKVVTGSSFQPSPEAMNLQNPAVKPAVIKAPPKPRGRPVGRTKEKKRTPSQEKKDKEIEMAEERAIELKEVADASNNFAKQENVLEGEVVNKNTVQELNF